MGRKPDDRDLAKALEGRKISRMLQNELAIYDGLPWQLKIVTGQEPLGDDGEEGE